MRYIQNFLLIIGFVASGILSCSFGLGILSAITIFRLRPGEDPGLAWGSAIGVMFLMIVGAVVGAIGGLICAIRRIARSNSEAWHPLIWVGIVVGILISEYIHVLELFSRFGILSDLIHAWPGRIILPPSLGTLGGVAGAMLAPMFGKKRKSTRGR